MKSFIGGAVSTAFVNALDRVWMEGAGVNGTPG